MYFIIAHDNCRWFNEHLVRVAYRCNPDSHYQPSGASSLFSGEIGKGNAGNTGDDKIRKKVKGYRGPGLEIKVDAVDFRAWMGRLKLTSDDTVILKIDIEGAEIPLLRHFLAGPDTSPACNVDVFYIEWHSWMIASAEEASSTKEFEDTFLSKVSAICDGKEPKFGSWH